MSRTRAGAARPQTGIGGAAVDVTDRLLRQLGRVVPVTSANVERTTFREDAAPMTWVSAVVTAPAANAVIADTGALAAGDYDFDVSMSVADTTLAAGKCLLLEHRNAANAATLFTLGLCPQQGSKQYRFRRYTMALNERLRVINGAVAGLAASRWLGAIGWRIT